VWTFSHLSCRGGQHQSAKGWDVRQAVRLTPFTVLFWQACLCEWGKR
jgi:hypothetical protein